MARFLFVSVIAIKCKNSLAILAIHLFVVNFNKNHQQFKWDNDVVVYILEENDAQRHLLMLVI